MTPTDLILIFLPKWRVVVCEACGYCLRPTESARQEHLRAYHYVQMDAANTLNAQLRNYCQDWLTPKDRVVATASSPIPGVKVTEGWKCLSCPYLTTSLPCIERHLSLEHKTLLNQSGRQIASLTSKCKFQKLFRGDDSKTVILMLSPTRSQSDTRDEHGEQIRLSLSSPAAQSSLLPTQDSILLDGFQCLKCTGEDPYGSVHLQNVWGHLREKHHVDRSQTTSSNPLWSACKLTKRLGGSPTWRSYIVVSDPEQRKNSYRQNTSSLGSSVLPQSSARPAVPQLNLYDGFRCLKCTRDPYGSIYVRNVRDHLQSVHGVWNNPSPTNPLWTECQLTKTFKGNGRSYAVVSQQNSEPGSQPQSGPANPFPFPDWTFSSSSKSQPEVYDGFQCLLCTSNPYGSVKRDRMRDHIREFHGERLPKSDSDNLPWSKCKLKKSASGNPTSRMYTVIVQQEEGQQKGADSSTLTKTASSLRRVPAAPAALASNYTVHDGFQCLRCANADVLTTDLEQMRCHMRDYHAFSLDQIRSSSGSLWSERKFSVLSSVTDSIRSPSRAVTETRQDQEASAEEETVNDEEIAPSRAVSEASVEFLRILERPNQTSVETNSALAASSDRTLKNLKSKQELPSPLRDGITSKSNGTPLQLASETSPSVLLSQRDPPLRQSASSPSSDRKPIPSLVVSEVDGAQRDPASPSPEPRRRREATEDPDETPEEQFSDSDNAAYQTSPFQRASNASYGADPAHRDRRSQAGRLAYDELDDADLSHVSQKSASAGVPVLDRHKDATFHDFTMDSDEEDRFLQSQSRSSKRARLEPRASGSLLPQKNAHHGQAGSASTSSLSSVHNKDLLASEFARISTPEYSQHSVHLGSGEEALRQSSYARKEKKYRENFRLFRNKFDLSRQQACTVLARFDGHIDLAWDTIHDWIASMYHTYGISTTTALDFMNVAEGKFQLAESNIRVIYRSSKHGADRGKGKQHQRDKARY